MSYIRAALEVGRVLGSVGAVATLGEAIGKRVGLIKEDTSLLVEGTNIALDVLGAPKNSAIRPGKKAPDTAAAPQDASAMTVGDASEPAEPRIVCVDCHVSAAMPLISGIAGESIILGQCQKHYEQNEQLQGAVGAMYEGWAQSVGLGESLCGPKPNQKDAKYKKYINIPLLKKNVPTQDMAAYLKDLVQWQDCIAKEKAQNQKQTEAVNKAKGAASKKSAFALAMQAKKYKKEIDDLQAKIDAEQDAQKKAAMQAQIDSAVAAKEAAEKLAAEVQQSAKDAETQAKIDALTATINAQADKPGGMSEFMQQLMLQMFANQQSQSAQAPMVSQVPMMQMDPLAMLAPAEIPVPVAAPGSLVYEQDPYGQDPFALFGTAPDDAPMDPEAADVLGFPGVSTIGEARALFELRQGGNFSDEDIAGILDAPEEPASSCSLGSCGVLRG